MPCLVEDGDNAENAVVFGGKTNEGAQVFQQL